MSNSQKTSPTQHYYNTHATSLTNRYEQAEMATTHEKLAEFFTPGDRLLECGSGSGRDSAFLLHKGMDITASDSSLEMIAEALRHHPELTDRMVNLQIPEGLKIYPPGSFDGVFSIATIMHLDQSQITAVLKQVYLILRPGGKLYYSICLERSGLNQAGVDNKGRYFLIQEQKWWENLTTETGFSLINTMINSDGLGREEVIWLTLQAAKP
ncbi:MAG: class I SAM-dependent methyltransferase [Deltaproteobacteria bacterium]|nr:class I SAM-dependent methyltransferase [Deltaproteobacteria bacterium]